MKPSQAGILLLAVCLLPSGLAISWSSSAVHDAATHKDDPVVAKMTVGTKYRKHAQAAEEATKAAAVKEKVETPPAKEGAEKEEKPIADGKSKAEKGGDHHGVLIAIGMFCTIALLSMVIAMLQTQNEYISARAWFVVDQVILIFLAVMNYQAFGALLDCCISSPSGKILAAFLQAFGLFGIAFCVSWKMKSAPVALAIFCGGGAHFVSFASIHLTEVVEDAYSGDEHLWRKLLVFAGFCALFFIFSAGVYFLKKRARLNDDAWDDKITDTENDFIAMALAVVFTTFVFHLVIGKDHDLEVEPDDADRLSHWKEFQLIIYALAMIPISVGLQKFLAKRQSAEGGGGVLVPRLAMFFSAFCAMCSCWALIFLSQMHFYSKFCSNRPLFCRIVFAMMTNMVAAVGIIFFARLSRSRFEAAGPEADLRTLDKDVAIGLTALSLAAGWSWEQTFDAAIESSADHFGSKMHHVKFVITISLICIILPTYATYIKPVADQKTKSLG